MPDRQWRVTIVPGSAFIKRNLSAAYWWILFIGLFLTAWVAAFLNFLATARYRAELLVELRTRELNKEKESLAKSEERFRQLAEGTGEFIWEVDRDGLYTYASPMVEKMYGYKPEEIVGKKYFYDFFPPEEKEKMVQGIFAGFKKKEVFRDFLNPIIHRNGQTVLLTSNAMPMVDGSGNLLGYRGIDRDITAAKIAEEALRRREAYLTSILDNFPYLVWLKDVHGKYLSVNSIFAKACGRDIHEIVGKGDEGLWPPELVEKYRADDRQVMQNQSKAVFEEPIVENGVAGYFETYKSPIFDNEGLVIGTVGFAQDITERKKAEAALRESEERYKKITSSITDYIYTVHVADGKPVSTTYGPGCLPVTGYSSEDFLSRSSLWIEIVVPEDRPIVERQIGDIFSGTKIDPIEHRICHKNGQIRWVSNTIVPQYDNTGKLVGYDGLIADISERKKAEEVLKQAKETAEKALAMKDEFTSTVSHELRTPLAAIKSSVDILDMGAPGNLNDEQRVFIKRVKSNIDRLARLINEILDLSKLESGKRRLNLVPLFPEVFVREIVELQSTVVKNKGLKIGMDLETNLPVFWADKDLLTQVLNNLINNALKFTKEGKIAISVSCPDRKMMQFCVRDTGIGIKQEDQVRLFQKFQQVGAVSQQIGGTGLGLAICREIVTRHGGRIWVESEFAKGSAFYFTIPEKKRKRILIVRDDQAAKDNMEGVLSQSDQYEIEQAPDGFMTGQTSAEFAPPDLVILDLELPQMNGLKVCSAIKGDSKTVDTKIIVLSDLLTEEQEKRVWEAGADDLLKKPIHPEEMILKIERLI
jgi:PAS domain S-box-containing protein